MTLKNVKNRFAPCARLTESSALLSRVYHKLLSTKDRSPQFFTHYERKAPLSIAPQSPRAQINDSISYACLFAPKGLIESRNLCSDAVAALLRSMAAKDSARDSLANKLAPKLPENSRSGLRLLAITSRAHSRDHKFISINQKYFLARIYSLIVMRLGSVFLSSR